MTLVVVVVGMGIGAVLTLIGVFAFGSWMESQDRVPLVERKRDAWQ